MQAPIYNLQYQLYRTKSYKHTSNTTRPIEKSHCKRLNFSELSLIFIFIFMSMFFTRIDVDMLFSIVSMTIPMYLSVITGRLSINHRILQLDL